MKLRMNGFATKVDDLEMVLCRALAYADLRMEGEGGRPFLLDELGNEIER